MIAPRSPGRTQSPVCIVSETAPAFPAAARMPACASHSESRTFAAGRHAFRRTASQALRGAACRGSSTFRGGGSCVHLGVVAAGGDAAAGAEIEDKRHGRLHLDRGQLGPLVDVPNFVQMASSDTCSISTDCRCPVPARFEDLPAHSRKRDARLDRDLRLSYAGIRLPSLAPCLYCIARFLAL